MALVVLSVLYIRDYYIRKMFEDVKSEIVLDLKHNYGRDLGIRIVGDNIQIYFKYGASNYLYDINEENYLEVYEP